jgi:predicted nuclease of predicted toxin-antitoxin system
LKILLDENFPLPLYHRLRAAGYDAEHIIVLGLRGVKDSELRKRLARGEIILLTQDTEFRMLPRIVEVRSSFHVCGKICQSFVEWIFGSRLFRSS